MSRQRLYMFPALLPLVEIVPLILTAIGALAGATGIAWKSGRKILIVSVVCFLAAGAVVFAALPEKEVRDLGSKPVPADQRAKVVTTGVFAPPPATQPLASFDDIWVASVKHQILATPVISGGVLILGTYKNTAEAYTLTKGELLWTLPQSEPIFTIGQGRGDTVYVAEGLHHTQAAMLTALRAPQGDVLWQHKFLGHIESPPEVNAAGTKLWFPSGAGGVWSLDARDGAALWHQPLGHTDATPLLSGDTLYAAFQPDDAVKESVLYALDANSGDIQWHTKLTGQPWGRATITADGKRLVMSTGTGQIGVTRESDSGWAWALSPKDGSIIWQKPLDNMVVEPGRYLAHADLAIFTLKSGILVALDTRDGSEIWRAKVGTEFMSPATLIERAGKPALVAATSSDGVFTIRNAATGEEVARRWVFKGASSAPVVSGDRIYVTTPYKIYAYGGVEGL